MAVTVQYASAAESTIPPEPPTLEEQIIREAEAQQVDSELAVRIAKCESLGKDGKINPKAKNPGSSASGVFQFIESTWRETINRMGLPADSDVFDASLNIKAGIWLMKRAGGQPWEASSPCWKNANTDIQRSGEIRRTATAPQ